MKLGWAVSNKNVPNSLKNYEYLTGKILSYAEEYWGCLTMLALFEHLLKLIKYHTGRDTTPWYVDKER